MKRFLLSAFLLTFSFAASAQKPRECSVSGTVLDSSNKPVSNAHIILDTPPTSWEDLIFTATSDQNGNFSYSTYCPFPNGKLTLFVSSSISFDNYTPFTPPFNRNNELGERFAGRPVINRKRSDVDLGNVYVQVYFSTVVVYFVDENSRPLIKDKENWQSVWIRLRSGKRRVSEGTLSQNDIEKAVRAKESAITMSLPEGEWMIEIRIDGDKWLKPNRNLIVQKSDGEIQETLKMSNKKPS
jgi:hypothetical protein